ncbi:acyltransferase family protein [Clostridium tarantellae]|uniref:Acyltransferase family protein n=1 Tax=Clostridium tarantellae TaxID=39493 RepID=A0A6I1MHN3_9CLOT|nr:acyltransferase family protein [Clostridium tarantellae]MPQ42915.1 acyltransferase family protein [Clostridium tarantellae]
MKEKKNRNYLLDNLKVILIFSVVFGHVIEFYMKDSIFLKSIYIYIYIFHMPLFVFTSGYFSKNIEKCRKSAVKKLLLPYLFFNILWYTIVYIGTGKFMLFTLASGWTLWYLLSLFFWRILLKYLIKIKLVIPISIIMGLLVGMLPTGQEIISFSRTITFLPFFLLGYYTHNKNLKKINKLGVVVATIGIILSLIIAFNIAENNLIYYKFLYNSQSYVSTGLSNLQGVYFRVLLYFGSIIFSICVINVVPKSKTFYSYIGRWTMNIYVFHIYLILVLYALIPKWNLSLIQNTLIIISPFIIIFILSLNWTQKLYDKTFNPIYNLYDKLIKFFYK